MPTVRTHGTRPTKLMLGLLACLALVGCTAGDDAQESAFDPAPDCFGIEPAGLDGDEVECGTVKVPLHHDEPDGESIGVATAVLAGSDGAATPDDASPVLLVGGEPERTSR